MPSIPSAEVTSSTVSSAHPQRADEVLASCLRQLTFAVRDVQFAVNRLHVVIDTDARVNDTLTALNDILSSNDPPSSAAAAPAASPVTIDEEPVLVTASDITDTASAAAADASVVGDSTSAEKWYAVIVGREPGVHCGAATVTSNVQRISGSQVVKCASQAQAQQLFDAALEAGQVEKVASIVTRTKMTQADFA